MGILSDIEDNLTAGNGAIIEVTGNEDHSELKRFFNLLHEKTPFSVKDDTLYVKLVSNFYNSIITKIDSEKDTFKSITGTTVDTINIDESFTMHAFVPVTSENTCNNIECDEFHSYVTEIDGVNIKTKVSSVSFANASLPIKLSNMSINRFSNPPKNTYCGISINSNHLPVFKNVTSSTFNAISIKDPSNNIFRIENWSKIFDFGFTVTTNDVKPKTIAINSFENIYKLASSTRYLNKLYSEYPYKLKANAKLSDLIDISGFENLENLLISDRNICVQFLKNMKASTYFDDTLKTDVDIKHFVDSLPTTADGFKVVIYKL